MVREVIKAVVSRESSSAQVILDPLEALVESWSFRAERFVPMEAEEAEE